MLQTIVVEEFLLVCVFSNVSLVQEKTQTSSSISMYSHVPVLTFISPYYISK